MSDDIAEALGDSEDQGIDLIELGDPAEPVAEPWDDEEDDSE